MGTDRQGRRPPLRRRPLNPFAFGRLPVLAAAAALCGAALWLVIPPAAHPAGPPPDVAVGGPVVVRGALHVHSVHSDGSGTVDEIAAAAGRAGLDFVILTDHGDGTRLPPPAYRAGVLTLEAVEISTDGGHYVALGMSRAPYPLGGEAAGVVEDVARLGGLGIAAHPASPRPELAWRDWSLPIDGVEWLNADSQWRDEGPAALAAAAAGYAFRAPESLAAILDRPVAALARWDALAAGRRVVGLAAVDAHARLPLGGGDHESGGLALRFPGYEPLFRTFSLRVELPRAWTGGARADAAALLAALRGGRVFSVIDALAEFDHFRYRARGAGAQAAMGEWIATAGEVALDVRAGGPPGREIVLLRNGKDVARTGEAALRFRASAGAGPAAYRAEVRLPDAPGAPPVPWIVSNPIWLGAPPAAPSAPPPPAPAVAARLDAPERWRAESSRDSTAAVERTDDGVRLRFRLGAGRGRFAAAAYELPPDLLRPGAGFAFEAAASRPLRAWLQLRVAPGGRRWARSFHAGEAPAEVRVGLDEMRPLGDAPAAAPTAGAASLLVVVDAVNSAPGAAAVLTLRAPRLVAAPAAD